MRYFFFLLSGLLLFSCAGESGGSNRETPGVSSPAAQTPQTQGTTQPPLKLAGEFKNAASGQEVCLNVSVGNFSMLLSMQYSLKWDPKVLTFKEVKKFGLPYLGIDNFGAHRSKDGILTFVWIDQALKGTTVADGGVIYQVCFTATGKPGQSTYFRFTGDPTPIEVVNLAEQVIGLETADGGVEIR